MAVTVEQLSVKISADAKEFSQVLGKITTQLDSLQNETSKVGKSIGGNLFGTIIKANAVTAVLGRTVGALGGTLKNVGTTIVKNGSSFSRLGVATQVVAKNAGITTEQLRGLNEQLVEANTYGSVADSVIRNLALSGLVQMADGLKAVDARTGETATGVNALVLSVKDLGAVAGIGSGQAIQEITRFINTGEQTEAVREMLAGIANLRIEYNEFGKELSAQEQAQARLNIVMREAGKSFGAYALTYETSGKIISSIGEVIRNIAEIIGSALEPILRVASSGILQLFNAIRASLFSAEDGFVDLGLTVRNWATSVAGYIVVVIRVLGALLSRLPVVGKNFNSLANFSLKNLKASDKLGSSIANTGGAMKDASKDAKALKKELAGLAGFDELNVLKEPDTGTEAGGVSGAGALGGGLGEGGLVDIEDINETANIVNAKAEEIAEKFRNLKARIVEFIESVKVRFGEIMQNPFVQGFVNLVKTLASEIKNNLLKVWESLKTAFIDLMPTLQKLWDRLLPIWLMIQAISAIIVGALVNAFLMWLDPAIKVIGFAIKWLIEAFINWLDSFRLVWDIGKKFVEFLKQIPNYLRTVGNWITDLASRISNGLVNAFNWAWNVASNFMNNLKAGFAIMRDYIVNKVEDIKNRVTNAFYGVKDGVVNIWSSVESGVKGGINKMIDLLNKFFGKLNNFKLPDWTGLGNVGFAIPNIPRLAQGGVVTAPTMAMIGESGAEVVMPLENNTGWIDKLAERIGSGGNTIVVKIGEEEVYNKFIDFVNDKTMASNTQILRI
jgi:phage-related protein